MPKVRSKIYLGIDPGKSGGIATIQGKVVRLESMPATEQDLLHMLKTTYADFAVLEKVHSMPGEGHAGAFTFGKGFGSLIMGLLACEIPFEFATPRTWQKHLSIRTRRKAEKRTEWKNHLKSEAQRLFPGLHITLKTADALLIAEYCRRKQKGI